MVQEDKLRLVNLILEHLKAVRIEAGEGPECRRPGFISLGTFGGLATSKPMQNLLLELWDEAAPPKRGWRWGASSRSPWHFSVWDANGGLVSADYYVPNMVQQKGEAAIKQFKDHVVQAAELASK